MEAADNGDLVAIKLMDLYRPGCGYVQCPECYESGVSSPVIACMCGRYNRMYTDRGRYYEVVTDHKGDEVLRLVKAL